MIIFPCPQALYPGENLSSVNYLVFAGEYEDLNAESLFYQLVTMGTRPPLNKFISKLGAVSYLRRFLHLTSYP
jgi:hypothetical protein